MQEERAVHRPGEKTPRALVPDSKASIGEASGGNESLCVLICKMGISEYIPYLHANSFTNF